MVSAMQHFFYFLQLVETKTLEPATLDFWKRKRERERKKRIPASSSAVAAHRRGSKVENVAAA